MKIAHVINTVEIQQKHKWNNLDIAQGVTLETMLHAKQQAGVPDVELFSIKHKDANFQPPEGIGKLPDLQRCCYDISKNLSRDRDFPLIQDVIDTLLSSSDADIFVYTNADIGLLPNFYNFIYGYLSKTKYDMIAINRRDIDPLIHGKPITKNNVVENFDTIKRRAAYKKAYHPGTDCFVFSREVGNKFDFGKIIIGRPSIGLAFIRSAMEMKGRTFQWINKEETRDVKKYKKTGKLKKFSCIPYSSSGIQTFHLGFRIKWSKQEKDPWYLYNEEAFNERFEFGE